MEDDQRMLLGPKGLIKRPELVRVMIQALHCLGYSRTASKFESESGISLEIPKDPESLAFDSLKSHILNGNWEASAKMLWKANDLTDEARSKAMFLVLRSWMIECVSEGDLSSLTEIVHLQKNDYQFTMSKSDMENLDYFVTRFEDYDMMDYSVDVISIPLCRKELVEYLKYVLPPEIKMTERRLESLVETTIRAQINSCSYHNSADPISLLEDHCCCRDQFPTETVQVLQGHSDEVWFVKFSNNGKYLASSSKDCRAMIWKVIEDHLELMHTLKGHEKPVSFVSWSPSDSMLLTCGQEEVIRLWNVDTGCCLRIFNEFGLTLSSCAWLPDEKGIFYGNIRPRKYIFMHKFDDNRIKSFSGGRKHMIRDFALTPNGKYLIIVSSDNDILIRNLETRGHSFLIEESAIVSISISEDSEFLIMNLNNQEIHIRDLNGIMTEPFNYRGHKLAGFVIHSCFGGYESMFIASGSEDSQVYIWKRRNEKPLEVLAGHLGTVNCVSWNPKMPEMLASASDDCTVRIWGPKKPKRGGS
ncbi:WD repeat-containing protein WDS homolog [Cornus florida]|uniref:WD repeat-containing protein WDS homolog n=1 Tax=Cornus florida TaxID=4283 RepID=UPI00289A2A0B|nr:WD repeat-containing protein WDS homolog [Cornus florida]